MREKVLRMQSISYSQDSLYFFYKIISTHLLTVLIIRAIVQLEQKKGVQREQKEQKVECSRLSKEFPIWSLETAKLRMKNKLEK